MKRMNLLGFVAFLLFLFSLWHPPVIEAACYDDGKVRDFYTTVSTDPNVDGNSVTIYFTPKNGAQTSKFYRAEQCGKPQKVSGKIIYCDTATDMYAMDSVRAPICGSTPERERANSTCYQCGGDVRCDGLDYALGNTDDFIFLNKQSIDNSPTTDVWRVPAEKIPASFMYNGMRYNKTGGLVVCRPNNQACGASDAQCDNIIYPNINNYGSSGQDQCSDSNAPATNTTNLQPNCQSNTPIDLLRYIAPENCRSNPSSCVMGGSVFSGDSIYQGVPNSVQWNSSNEFRQNTNNHAIKYKIENGAVKMCEDHTWEDEQSCQNGDPAYQVTTDGAGGCMKRYPTSMACGSTFSFSGKNEARNAKTNQVCTNPNAGSQPNNGTTLLFQGTMLCNGHPENVIALQNSAGAGKGEVYFYCEGKGLCSWYSSMDATNVRQNPSNWGPSTDICSGNISSRQNSCTLIATPQVASQMKLPHNQDWVVRNTKFLPDYIRLKAFNLFQIGIIKPANDILKLTRLTEIGNQANNSRPKLMPQSLSYQPLTHELSFSANTRLCYLSSENAIKDVLPERNIISTQQYPDLNKVVPNAEIFDAMWGTHKISERDRKFNERYRDKVVDVKNAHPCEVKDAGDRSLEQTVNTLGNQEYSEPDEDKAPSYKLSTYFANIAANVIEWFTNNCVGKNCQVETDTGAYVEFSTHASYIDTAGKHIGKDGDLEKGFANTFRPNICTLNKNNAETKNNINQEVGSNKEMLKDQPVLIKSAAEIVEKFGFMNCSLLNPTKQQEANINCICNGESSVINTSSIPPSSTTAPLSCKTDLFSQIQRPNSGGGNGGSQNNLTGYTIPYRDSSCRLSADKGSALADFAVSWSTTVKNSPSLTAQVRKNILDNWQTIQQKAVEFGWNPVFILSLWVEESAASGVPVWQMGCKYGWDKNGGSFALSTTSDACSQEACLMSHPKQDPNNFQEFMCSYNTGVCNTLKPGDTWDFANAVKLSYGKIAGDIGNLPTSCQIRQAGGFNAL